MVVAGAFMILGCGAPLPQVPMLSVMRQSKRGVQ
jgi:hypothetical protein